MWVTVMAVATVKEEMDDSMYLLMYWSCIPHCEVALIHIPIRLDTRHYRYKVFAFLVEPHRVRHG
jgi:hypothetical protein